MSKDGTFKSGDEWNVLLIIAYAVPFAPPIQCHCVGLTMGFIKKAYSYFVEGLLTGRIRFSVHACAWLFSVSNCTYKFVCGFNYY